MSEQSILEHRISCYEEQMWGAISNVIRCCFYENGRLVAEHIERFSVLCSAEEASQAMQNVAAFIALHASPQPGE